MPKQKKTATGRALKVIKGGSIPLTNAQQSLIAIFVEHLRALPPYKDGEDGGSSSWDSYDFELINTLLSRHFKAKYPQWKKNEDGNFCVSDMPEGDEFTRLMRMASNADDPAIKIRAAFLRLAQDKQRVLWCAERYEKDREHLGLSRENLIKTKPPLTPLESAAQNRYDDNHDEFAVLDDVRNLVNGALCSVRKVIEDLNKATPTAH